MENPSFAPYQNEAFDKLYEFLFCDNLPFFEANNTASGEFPWNVLFSKTPDQNALLDLANDDAAESRVRNLACVKLKAIGSDLQPKMALLGAVIEVGLDEGLDVLAGFADGTARYINHAQKMIIWESPTEALNALIDNLWYHSINVVNKIGPWKGARLAPPETGMVRLSFLVSGQLFFGQGPVNVFFGDPMAGPVLDAATKLMQFLTENA